MIDRNVFGTDVRPDKLNDVLARQETPFIDDDILVWSRLEALYNAFNRILFLNRQHTAAELDALQAQGWEIVLRLGNSVHFVYLSHVEPDGNLVVIDPWGGKYHYRSPRDFTGVRGLLTVSEQPKPPPEPEPPLLVGFHDESGGRAYPKALCLSHHIVRHSVERIDLNDTGPSIVRLNYNYAYQDGTIAPPSNLVAWRNAVIDTILSTKGNILCFHIGNEINNPSEWGPYPNISFVLSPQYYVHEVYNPIWQAVKKLNPNIKLAPAPLDPYNVVAQEFGQPGDPKDWATYIYEHITGADAICLHAKTQTNDPAEIISFAKFSHPPLVGRYLHLRTLTDQLSWIPQRFADKPVYVTELNPQFRVQDKEVGWYAENTCWIHDSHTFISTYPEIRGITYYRYDVAGDQANYGLRQFPALLDTIKNYIEV